MNSKERICRILKRQPVDRIGAYEHYWDETRVKWLAEGIIKEDETFAAHFKHDLDLIWPFDLIADLDFSEQLVAETEETVTIKNGNYAILRNFKNRETTPEHVGYDIAEACNYYEKIKPLLKPDRRRVDFKVYRDRKAICERNDRFFAWSGMNVFEIMQKLTGHENLLVGMALEPDWIKEMAMDYAKLIAELWKILFSEEGKPDGIYFYEDLGFKGKPFMSPDMFRNCIKPAHKYLFDFAKTEGLPVIMHSCGFVEPLIPDFVDAGLDMLDVMEVKAGMDPLRIFKNFGHSLSFMGGIDVRCMYNNDKNEIDRELESKIPLLKQNYGYVLHSDHSIPANVSYDIYRYFLQKGLELGKY